MYPDLNIGPITLHTFGLMFALAFLAAGAVVGRRLKELDKPVDWAYEIIFAALVGGVVGARVYYIIQNNAYDSSELLSGSGLVWYGGAIGGATGVLGWAWYRGFLGLTLLDVCAPALALGYAIGRIGCSPATATTASHGTGAGRWRTPTAPSRPARRFTRHRSTRPWRWGWGRPGPLEPGRAARRPVAGGTGAGLNEALAHPAIHTHTCLGSGLLLTGRGVRVRLAGDR